MKPARQIPSLLEGDRLVSSLDRNSAYRKRHAALASTTDTSGRSDNAPVLAQHAESAASSSTENVLPRHGVLAWNLDRSVEKVPVGEPSLSGEPECLSLPGIILPQESKNGNADPTPVSKRGLAFLPIP